MEHVLSPGMRANAAAAGRAATSHRRAVAAWLFACCALVFSIIVVGGVTRLTRSGLSITEWQPIVGTLPPLDAAQWEEAFAKYRATPEYRLVNHAMDLAGFKQIFWWEYFHRLLGRLIGLAFLLPLVAFAVKRRLPRGYGVALAGIFALGALQGAMGWYMVKSGLVDDPRVSQFRLTAHLGIALAIFASMLWVGLSVACGPAGEHGARAGGLRRFAQAVIALVFVMALTGGFVAGIRAGFAYNTFPLMNGSLVPPEILVLEPWWRNFFWNMATVQFVHRTLAWLLVLVVPLLWWQLARAPGLPMRVRAGGHLLLAALAVQVALGIATLLAVVPVHLAAAHQAGAVLVLAAAVNVAHALRAGSSR
jgi:cytochrome c oxidase assembly protein subunit 15